MLKYIYRSRSLQEISETKTLDEKLNVKNSQKQQLHGHYLLTKLANVEFNKNHLKVVCFGRTIL